MEIRSVEFVKSSAHPRECPQMDRPEYAFIGRSNVGKSSLINMVVGRTSMAKISGTPGKTQLINHFDINGDSVAEKAGETAWYLTDLPGFGYAKISKSERIKWERTSKQFLEGRKNMMCTMMLIDSRLSPQKVDLEFMAYMGEVGLLRHLFCILFLVVNYSDSISEFTGKPSHGLSMSFVRCSCF